MCPRISEPELVLHHNLRLNGLSRSFNQFYKLLLSKEEQDLRHCGDPRCLAQPRPGSLPRSARPH